MKKQVNLIPQEMAVASRSVNLAKTLNKISTLGFVVLVVLVVFLIAGLIYYNFDYRKSVARVNNLKDKIVELERSEQKLILAKNKLSKIASVANIDMVDKELISFKNFQNSIIDPAGVSLEELAISSANTGTAFIVKDTGVLATILSQITKLKDYKKIILTSLNYSPNTGFTANLIFED